jgi:hypothetical protein
MVLLLVLVLCAAMLTVNANTACNLFELGRKYKSDKMLDHIFYESYCDTLQKYVGMKDLRVLEIGFGCGHHVHGSSAQLWREYFDKNGTTGMKLYEVDLDTEKHRKCVDDFLEKNGPYTNNKHATDVYLGDQGNAKFMEDVVKKSGGNYDIIIDDGGHQYHLSHVSFHVLWEHLKPGGIYFIEDLQIYRDDNNPKMMKEIYSWIDQLATARRLEPKAKAQGERGPLGGSDGYGNVENEPYFYPKPRDMMWILCQHEMCAFRKKPTTKGG